MEILRASLFPAPVDRGGSGAYTGRSRDLGVDAAVLAANPPGGRKRLEGLTGVHKAPKRWLVDIAIEDNTPVQTNTSYPMIDLAGLLNLVAVLNRSGLRPWKRRKLMSTSVLPPSPRSRRLSRYGCIAARRESPTPPRVAHTSGAPDARCSAGEDSDESAHGTEAGGVRRENPPTAPEAVGGRGHTPIDVASAGASGVDTIARRPGASAVAWGWAEARVLVIDEELGSRAQARGVAGRW